MKIHIEVSDQQVNGFLSRLKSAGVALRPAFNEIGETLVQNTRLRFSESRAPDGSPWKPLAMSTLLGRRRGSGGARFKGGAIPSAQPLLDTGQLRNSVTHRASDTEVIVGTRFGWARFHQLGGRRLPQRVIFGISADDRAEIVPILREHFFGVA